MYGSVIRLSNEIIFTSFWKCVYNKYVQYKTLVYSGEIICQIVFFMLVKA
jgi:hypothetical protein